MGTEDPFSTIYQLKNYASNIVPPPAINRGIDMSDYEWLKEKTKIYNFRREAGRRNLKRKGSRTTSY